jgi:hypothetical protein
MLFSVYVQASMGGLSVNLVEGHSLSDNKYTQKQNKNIWFYFCGKLVERSSGVSPEYWMQYWEYYKTV